MISCRLAQLKLFLFSLCVVLLLPIPALSQHWFGVLRGVTWDSSTGKPLAEAEVSASNVDDASKHRTFSGKDGSFLIRVEPGTYEVAATKDGFLRASSTLTVPEMVVRRVDLRLNAAPPADAVNSSSAEAGDAKAAGQSGISTAPQLMAQNRAAAVPSESAADVPRTAAVPTPEATPNVAMLKELESLRARIEQLEAELAKPKPQTSVSTPAAPANVAPATAVASATREASPAPAPVAPVSVPASTQAPASAQPPASPPVEAKSSVPAAANPVDMETPFADYDWTWLNGNSRTKDSPLESKYFTGEFRADTHYGLDFNQPVDHSMGGSSEVFRSGEVQLEQISLGGDLHVGNVRGRILTLFGMFAQTTPRNDASVAVGQWDARTSYRYLAEAYGGYHFNVNHGLNVDAGLFVSYVGLFSYYNFDNWAYQPSYVSSNTPWFFNGVRVQWFPTHHLKIEPWFVNGWQSYNRYNGHPGLGGQLKWTPKDWLNILSNNYGVGNDNIGLKNRGRYHTDNSVEVKYFDRPEREGIDKMAFTLTGDMGCETGDGVTCHGGKGGPKQSFLGWMAYDRTWFDHDRYAVTLGGGAINNPGRYLTLVLPINGADAVSGTPYFPASPGSTFKAYDTTATLDWMPSEYFTFRTEFGYRHANVPYFTGRHGITPPGGNNGSPADFVCKSGASSGVTDLPTAQSVCGGANNVWFPDLRKSQAIVIFSIMVKF